MLKFDMPDGAAVVIATVAGVVSVLLFDLLKLAPAVQRVLGAARS